MKKTIAVIVFYLGLHSNTSFAQDVVLGEPFSKYVNDCVKVGENYQTSETTYNYKKSISKPMYSYAVQQISILVKANKVIGFIYFLNPKSSDIGVPKKFIEDFQNDMGIKLKYGNNKYYASDGNIGVQISRQNLPEYGGDKIVMFTKLLK